MKGSPIAKSPKKEAPESLETKPAPKSPIKSDKPSSPVKEAPQSPAKSPAKGSMKGSPIAKSPKKEAPESLETKPAPKSPIKNQTEAIKSPSPIRSNPTPLSPKGPKTLATKRPLDDADVDDKDDQAKKPKLAVKPDSFSTLYLEKFVRPMNIESLKLKLGEFGPVEKFWMNRIRSSCLVTVYISLSSFLVCYRKRSRWRL
jgi:hypothetical protein